MKNTYTFHVLGHIRNDYKEKFGIPRQSGLAEDLVSEIVLEPEYRIPEAFRGIEEYDRLWLVWIFSENADRGWSPTVRPPKLGGNRRVGVFASRSPFRPNPVGISCVKLAEVKWTEKNGPVLVVSGADLMDGTPVVDIKPYVPYADSFPDARSGFSSDFEKVRREVCLAAGISFPDDMNESARKALTEVLSQDPRPGYQHDEDRVYGMNYGKWNVRFQKKNEKILITGFEVR